MRPVIQSTKHISQSTGFTVAATAITAIQPIIAVVPADVNLTTECEEGSIIKALYCEYWLTSDDAASGFFVFSVEKLNTTQTSMLYAESVSLGVYANKKNIFYTSQGLTAPITGTPTPVVRQWIKIPKGKQRFGLGDKININISGIANGVQVCGMTILKSYK